MLQMLEQISVIADVMTQLRVAEQHDPLMVMRLEGEVLVYVNCPEWLRAAGSSEYAAITLPRAVPCNRG